MLHPVMSPFETLGSVDASELPVSMRVLGEDSFRSIVYGPDSRAITVRG